MLVAGYLVIALVVAFMPVAVMVRVVSALLVAAVGGVAVWRLGRRRGEKLVLDDSRWQWCNGAGEVRDIDCTVVFRSPWLVMLRMSPAIGPVNTALWRDSTDSESWRQLHRFAAERFKKP